MTTPIIIEAQFIIEAGDEDDDDLSKEGKSKNPSWHEKWANVDGLIQIRKVWQEQGKPGVKQTFDPTLKDWVDGGFGGFDTLLTKYAPTPIAINAMETPESLENKINKLMNDTFLKKAKETYPKEYEAAQKAIESLQGKITDSDEVALINRKVNAQFKEIFETLTLEIKPKDSNKVNILKAIEKAHSVNVKKNGIEREESFSQNGHGIIRQALFNFIAFLQDTADGGMRKEFIILFEEPELFLHPKISYRLRRALYKLAENSPYQILCATHSSQMIDISKPHSSLIRITKGTDEKTTTYQIGDEVFQSDQNKQIVQMINRFNSFICEMFYADKVILVEGDTEAIVFRDLLERFAPNNEIFVVNTGSKNNIPFFQEVLAHFHIPYWVVHDSDTQKKRSAWTLNERIWEKIADTRLVDENLANRRVMIQDFESANNYKINKSDGKPLSAYNFVNKISSLDEEIQCCKYLRDMLENSQVLQDQSWLAKAISKN